MSVNNLEIRIIPVIHNVGIPNIWFPGDLYVSIDPTFLCKIYQMHWLHTVNAMQLSYMGQPPIIREKQGKYSLSRHSAYNIL